MKKALLLAAIVFGVFYSAMAETHGMDKGVPIQFGWNDTSTGGEGPIKTTPPIPLVYKDDHTLLFSGSHVDYTLQLINDSGVAYTTYVDTSTTYVFLPDNLAGNYELRLVTSSYYLFATINL